MRLPLRQSRSSFDRLHSPTLQGGAPARRCVSSRTRNAAVLVGAAAFHPRRIDDNPDVVRSLGRYELQATWLPGRATASATSLGVGVSLFRF